MRQSIENLVKDRIIDHGRGWCFTPMHLYVLKKLWHRFALPQLVKEV